MKRFRVILLLLAIPVALQAQALGRVSRGTEVFSTGFPDGYSPIPEGYSDVPPEDYIGDYEMSEKTREIAIRRIEKTFGKIKKYSEDWIGVDEGEHVFNVELESGDSIGFIDGCLFDFDIYSSRFSVARDYIPGGLRVGQKISHKKNWGKCIISHEDNSPYYSFFHEDFGDSDLYVVVDENNIIQSIHVSYCWV